MNSCRHCGQGPEADGDHTCPCPNPDQDCTEHPIVMACGVPADAPAEVWQALAELGAAVIRAEERRRTGARR